KATDEGSEYGSTIRQGLWDLIWSYIDPLTTSSSTDIRLVRLSAEALLTFKTFLPSHSSSSATRSRSSDTLIEPARLIDTAVDILLDDLTSLTSFGEKWRSTGRTFKACVIRILLWIGRNHPHRNPKYSPQRRKLFIASCRLWDLLEKEVHFSKTGSFGAEDKPLMPDDLKGIVDFAEWVQTQTQSDTPYLPADVTKCTFIGNNADVGINRLYTHLDRQVDWGYHFYGLHEDSATCSRSVYKEDRML
ncbi:hypothetical protein FRC00_011408, partial [Tulasnella sp. 408]